MSAASSALYRLPAPDSLYDGRDEDASDVVRSMKEGQVVCLLASAGMGKSSLAVDVAMRLWRDGYIKGGARFVDMREARTHEDVLGRFCATLEIQQVRIVGLRRLML